MNLEEAILDKVRPLPQAKQEEALRFADGLQRQNASGPGPSRDRARERIWMEQNRAAFAGQWVAVEGESTGCRRHGRIKGLHRRKV